MEEVRHVNRAAVARLFGRGGARGHTAAAVEPAHAPHKLSHNTGDDASKHAHRCVSSSTSAAAFVGPVPVCDGRPAWVEPRSVPMQRHQHVDVCSSGAVNERTSAIAMRQRIRRHEQFIPSVDEPDQHTRGVRGESASNNVVARLRSASQHARAVERYEHTIPQRRAVDEYINITGAQGDARLNIPNAYTAEKLALRNGGRWCLDNQHHQQLLRGEPIMTRVMAGEFYNERTPPAKLPNNATKNFVEANRFNVRAASCHLVEARRCKSACVATRGGVPRRRC